MRALLAIALLVGTAEARPFMPRQQSRSVFVVPPPVFDAMSGSNGNSLTTLSWSHTVGSGTNRVLVVVAHNAGFDCGGTAGGTISGATYGGTAMTMVGADDPSNSGCNHIGRGAVFYLVNPASGTANVVLSGTTNGSTTCSSNCSLHGTAVSYSGAAQTDPVRAIAAVGADTGAASTSVSSSTTDALIAYSTHGSSCSGGTWGNSFVERTVWNLDGSGASNNHVAATLAAGTGATQAGSWTPGTNDGQTVRLVSVKAP